MKTTVQNEPRTVPSNDRPREYVSPEVNIFETNDGYLLEAEMPGVNKNGLEITLENNELTITGHRQVESLTGQRLVGESGYHDFRRVFALDPAIDTGKISAKMEQGVLRLNLPKSEKVKPRKIAVE
jgi:HSP20 family protein